MVQGFYWSVCPRIAEDAPALSNFSPDLSYIIKQLLLQRGFNGGKATERFLAPKLSQLSDPFLMQGMQDTVTRILKAIDRRESICIYGDYDVDGVVSVTLLRTILSAYGTTPQYFIPVRSQEGYGLSHAGIERCLAECGKTPDLLITVDCGTSSVAEVAALNGMGIDVLVLDHHEIGATGKANALAMVNAKAEEKSAYTYLCSAGVVFKLLHALLKTRPIPGFELKDYLDLVAVATVSDIVPLVDENRILVSNGLKRLPNSKNLGLKTLTGSTVGPSGRSMRDLGINASHVGFRIGPRINAAGRMDSPLDALHLLLTQDLLQAQRLTGLLNEHNRKRQAEENAMRSEAELMLAQNFNSPDDHVIVLGSRNWHPGVVGIVASHLMRRYYKPTFIIALDEAGIGKGSGRSIPGVSLVQAIQACSNTLISGGGHEMAAGLVIEERQIDAFRNAFNRYVTETTTPEQRHPIIYVDLEVTLGDLTPEFLESYEKLEPFGNSNPKPVFMTSRVFPDVPPRKVGTDHLKFSLRQGLVTREAMFFNALSRTLPEPPWDIVFTVDKNVYYGRVSVSITIQEMRSHIDTAEGA